MAVQRFGGHRRAGRAIGPITGEPSKIAATNRTQKPIDAIPSLVRHTNAGPLGASQRHELPAHLAGVARIAGAVPPAARACVLRSQRIVDSFDYGRLESPVAA